MSNPLELSTLEMPDWLSDGQPAGTHVTEKGYLRIHARGPYRNWYHHRQVMQEMVDVFCFYGTQVLKDPRFTVHHLDHVRTNNQPNNLILLDKPIHDWLSAKHGWAKLRRSLSEEEVEELERNAREV